MNSIDYLQKFGYSAIQAYMVLGAAPIEGRPSGVVDIPNSCSTVYLPTAIFDFDVRPGKDGSHRIDPGQGVPHASAWAAGTRGGRQPAIPPLSAVSSRRRYSRHTSTITATSNAARNGNSTEPVCVAR